MRTSEDVAVVEDERPAATRPVVVDEPVVEPQPTPVREREFLLVP